MDQQAFTIEEALKHGWRAFMRRPLFWIGVQFVVFVVPFILDFIGGLFAPAPGSSSLFGGLLSFVMSVIAFGVSARLALGYTHISLATIDGSEPVIGDLLSKAEVFWRYLAAYILFSIAVSIGMFLLVVPGLYIISRFGLFGFGMVDRDPGIIESFSLSSRITEGHRWQIFLLVLLLAVINILAAIPFLLGLLVSLPVTFLTAAFVFRRLSEASSSSVPV